MIIYRHSGCIGVFRFVLIGIVHHGCLLTEFTTDEILIDNSRLNLFDRISWINDLKSFLFCLLLRILRRFFIMAIKSQLIVVKNNLLTTIIRHFPIRHHRPSFAILSSIVQGTAEEINLLCIWSRFGTLIWILVLFKRAQWLLHLTSWLLIYQTIQIINIIPKTCWFLLDFSCFVRFLRPLRLAFRRLLIRLASIDILFKGDFHKFGFPFWFFARSKKGWKIVHVL